MIAEPGSCSAIKKAGKKITIKAFSWFFMILKLYFLSLINFASASAVNAFENSDGWRLIPPKRYQDFAPLISVPKINSPIKVTKEKTKKILENCWKNLALINKIKMIRGMLNKIQRSCLPYFEEKSNIWILSSEWEAA